MKKLLYIACAWLMVEGALAQGLDPQLSNYMSQPLLVNPALTGIMESKWRVGLNVREQDWVISQPFRTGVLSYDMNLPINAWGGNVWGIGFNVIYDDQGDSRLRNNRVNGSFTLGQYLDPREKHLISVGFQGGLGQRSIDYTNLYWDNQWVGEGFALFKDPNENLPSEARSYFDMSTGVQYGYSGELMTMNAGYAMFHANVPDNSLYIDTNNTELSRRHTVHFEMEHRLTRDNMMALRPSFMFTRQGQVNNLIFGNDFVFFFNEPTRTTGKRSQYSMALGVYHRLLKDVIAKMQFNLAGFYLGTTYDVSVGGLSALNGYQGAYEVFVGYRAGFRSGSNSRYMPHRKGKL